MTYQDLMEKYNSHKANCCVCGCTLSTEGGNALGDFFLLNKDGQFYCMDCDIEFEEGDEYIFDPEDGFFENCTIDQLLERVSGILDQAYEFAEDSEERDYICKVEDVLHQKLRKAGVIK